MSETVEREVGRARYRKEDAHLITGQTNWTDNISVTGLLHIAILRSPMAHARIDRVDVSAALERPGVIAAFSGRDVAQEMGSLPCAWPVAEDTVVPDHPPVAVDEVRYAGDPVAVVVARDRYTAADALEAIEVDYTPLPAALDIEGALTDGAPLVHSDKGTERLHVAVRGRAPALRPRGRPRQPYGGVHDRHPADPGDPGAGAPGPRPGDGGGRGGGARLARGYPAG